jgi:hypothetical protein
VIASINSVLPFSLLQAVGRVSSSRAKDGLGLMLLSQIAAVWISDDVYKRQRAFERPTNIIKKVGHLGH